MCGRFVSARKRLELREEFSIERDRVADGPAPEPHQDYNVAPTRRAFAVVEPRPRKEVPDDPLAREPPAVPSCLIPTWATDASAACKLINTPAEPRAVRPA